MGEELKNCLTVRSGPKERDCGASLAPGSPDACRHDTDYQFRRSSSGALVNAYRPKTCQELEGAFSGVTVASKLEILTSHFKVPNTFPSNF